MVAAALFNDQGELLIAQRPVGKELAGHWEFPGGKLANGEDAADALQRELREELAIEVLGSVPFMAVVHEEPDRSLELCLRLVTGWRGKPLGLEGQSFRWVPLAQLRDADILEADRPFIVALQRRGVPPR